jgi:hypothetical protein
VSDTELLPKSKPEPVRRVEVFTGTGRRRAWAADEKARIIAESYAGGETVSADTDVLMARIDDYCKRHPLDNLYNASAALVDELRQ